MLPELKLDADGGLTLYIQHESPGKDKESNWLPAPNGPFTMWMRIYWPKVEALDATWKQPAWSARTEIFLRGKGRASVKGDIEAVLRKVEYWH